MKYNPHKTTGLARPCSSNDLFLVSEGLQCGNCLVLVKDNRPDPTPDPKPAETPPKQG